MRQFLREYTIHLSPDVVHWTSNTQKRWFINRLDNLQLTDSGQETRADYKFLTKTQLDELAKSFYKITSPALLTKHFNKLYRAEYPNRVDWKFSFDDKVYINEEKLRRSDLEYLLKFFFEEQIPLRYFSDYSAFELIDHLRGFTELVVDFLKGNQPNIFFLI